MESLKERLDKTQNQLVKMHETNIDLKSRLQKESSQVCLRSAGCFCKCYVAFFLLSRRHVFFLYLTYHFVFFFLFVSYSYCLSYFIIYNFFYSYITEDFMCMLFLVSSASHNLNQNKTKNKNKPTPNLSRALQENILFIKDFFTIPPPPQMMQYIVNSL